MSKLCKVCIGILAVGIGLAALLLIFKPQRQPPRLAPPGVIASIYTEFIRDIDRNFRLSIEWTSNGGLDAMAMGDGKLLKRVVYEIHNGLEITDHRVIMSYSKSEISRPISKDEIAKMMSKDVCTSWVPQSMVLGREYFANTTSQYETFIVLLLKQLPNFWRSSQSLSCVAQFDESGKLTLFRGPYFNH